MSKYWESTILLAIASLCAILLDWHASLFSDIFDVSFSVYISFKIVLKYQQQTGVRDSTISNNQVNGNGALISI